jgi:hypothetical protein
MEIVLNWLQRPVYDPNKPTYLTTLPPELINEILSYAIVGATYRDRDAERPDMRIRLVCRVFRDVTTSELLERYAYYHASTYIWKGFMAISHGPFNNYDQCTWIYDLLCRTLILVQSNFMSVVAWPVRMSYIVHGNTLCDIRPAKIASRGWAA